MPVLHKCSFSFWTSLRLSEAVRRQVILARPGTQCWPASKADHTSQTCRFLGSVAAHFANMQIPLATCRVTYRECSHCIIIERHNYAARLMLGALHWGSLGKCQGNTIADIGSQEKMAGLQQHDTRIPDFMLADNDLPEGPSHLRQLRLDIMITDITQGETLLRKPSRKRGRHGGQHNHHITATANGRARRVWIVEVGHIPCF